MASHQCMCVTRIKDTGAEIQCMELVDNSDQPFCTECENRHVSEALPDGWTIEHMAIPGMGGNSGT